MRTKIAECKMMLQIVDTWLVARFTLAEIHKIYCSFIFFTFLPITVFLPEGLLSMKLVKRILTPIVTNMRMKAQRREKRSPRSWLRQFACRFSNISMIYFNIILYIRYILTNQIKFSNLELMRPCFRNLI